MTAIIANPMGAPKALRPHAIYMAVCECLYVRARRKPEPSQYCRYCYTNKPAQDFISDGIQRVRCGSCRAQSAAKARKWYALHHPRPPEYEAKAVSSSLYAVQSSLDRGDRPDGLLIARTELVTSAWVPRGVSPAVAGYLRAIGRG
jgi:hypothetical protein